MIKIQLDIHALEKLFPEGTEAYFHFQNAVIAEASKRFTKGLSEARIRSIVLEHAKLVEAQVRNELGLKNKASGYSWSTPELSDEVKRSIKTEVDKQFTEEVRRYTKSLMPNIESEVHRYIFRNLHTSISDMMTKELELQMTGISGKIKDKIKLDMEKLLGPS